MSRGFSLLLTPPPPSLREKGCRFLQLLRVDEKKKKSIFLNTELIFKWPERDFLPAPKLFPLGDVRLGAGARGALGCDPATSPAWDEFHTQRKILARSEGTAGSVSHLKPCTGPTLGGTRTLHRPSE